ncbi:MAG: trypsin-like peptidase domain-containing protein [Betaproteobacteria bacterium]|nr:trypsin-like peptidase domain-containing protein [Betaproteobacteria bacterium]
MACASEDAARDAAIAERRHSVVLVSFVEGTEARVCSGTLINTERFPAPYIVTANHCIATAAAAASVTTLWFNEVPTCGAAAATATPRQVSGGAQLVFTSHAADSTLLLLARDAPAGAVFAGWDTAPLATATDIVSISHPAGRREEVRARREVSGASRERATRRRCTAFPTRGVTEGGSSGSRPLHAFRRKPSPARGALRAPRCVPATCFPARTGSRGRPLRPLGDLPSAGRRVYRRGRARAGRDRQPAFGGLPAVPRTVPQSFGHADGGASTTRATWTSSASTSRAAGRRSPCARRAASTRWARFWTPPAAP